MPNTYTGRVVFIIVLFLAALVVIFPPQTLFTPGVPFAQKIALKPGIDMVGGTSLLYEIKPPEGLNGGLSSDLASKVVDSLK